MKNRGRANIITGVFHQILNTGLGLVLPYFFLVSYGSETNGVINSVGQLFTCLALLEAGVGAATIQALYKPVANVDHAEISSILSATNKYYKKTGTVYAIGILLLCALYPCFVDAELSNTTIRLIIFFQGSGAVVNYFVQAKYNCLLRAEGKNYLLNCILILETLVKNFGKIIAIQLGYNIVTVQLVQFITISLEAVFVSTYIRKKYKWLDLCKGPNYKAIQQKDAVLVQSIAWMVFNHTDILLLTFFLRDLKLVSVYSIYLLIFEAIQNIINTIRNSLQYAIGRSVLGSADEFAIYYRKYSTVISAVTSSLFVITYLLSASFIKLYTSGTTDTNYLLPYLPELFFVYKFLYGFRAMNRQVIEAAGKFSDTQKIAITETLVNLLVSTLFIMRFGIHGVLMGSIVAVGYSAVVYIKFIEKSHFSMRKKYLLKQIIVNAVPAIMIIVFNQISPFTAVTYWELFSKGAVGAIGIVLIYTLIAAISIMHGCDKEN